jgi:uncharacterized protein (TIGR02246 family)
MKNTYKDEALIREIFNKSSEAWNTQNTGLFSSLYTGDVDYITFMGEHIRGLDANIKIHKELWAGSFMKGATMEGDILSIRFAGENTAVMIAKGGVKLRFHKKCPGAECL